MPPFCTYVISNSKSTDVHLNPGSTVPTDTWCGWVPEWLHDQISLLACEGFFTPEEKSNSIQAVNSELSTPGSSSEKLKEKFLVLINIRL